jgi:hypothetical protein
MFVPLLVLLRLVAARGLLEGHSGGEAILAGFSNEIQWE